MRFDVVVKADEHARAEAAPVVDALKAAKVPHRILDDPKDADADVAVVVGETGFLLDTMRDLPPGIPVLGVGGDVLGVLTEVTVQRFPDALRRIQRGDHWVEDVDRMACHVGGRAVVHALNEAAVTAHMSGQFVRYSLWVEGELVGRDRGDGVIVATPTGSTAYGLAAGGPVVLANTRVWSVVPICSSDGAHPVVVNQGAEISIRDVSAAGGADLVVDGRERIRLHRFEVVRVTRAPEPARFVRLTEKRYTQILGRLKLQKEVAGVLVDAPPSAKFVVKLLEYEGPLTQAEIIRESSLSPRTVRNALTWLIERGVAVKEPNLRDARQDVYNLTGTDAAEG